MHEWAQSKCRRFLLNSLGTLSLSTVVYSSQYEGTKFLNHAEAKYLLLCVGDSMVSSAIWD